MTYKKVNTRLNVSNIKFQSALLVILFCDILFLCDPFKCTFVCYQVNKNSYVYFLVLVSFFDVYTSNDWFFIPTIRVASCPCRTLECGFCGFMRIFDVPMLATGGGFNYWSSKWTPCNGSLNLGKLLDVWYAAIMEN